MKTVIIIIQLIVSLILVGAIVLQAKGTGLDSSIMGGGGEFYSSKRGIEKFVLIGTIVLVVLFAVLSIALLVLP